MAKCNIIIMPGRSYLKSRIQYEKAWAAVSLICWWKENEAETEELFIEDVEMCDFLSYHIFANLLQLSYRNLRLYFTRCSQLRGVSLSCTF